MSSKLSDILESKQGSTDNNCQLDNSSSNTIANCSSGVKKPTSEQVDWAVDYAIKHGVAVRKFPDGHDARAWYCKVANTVGVDKFMELVQRAKQEGEGSGSKLFSVLIAKTLKAYRV